MELAHKFKIGASLMHKAGYPVVVLSKLIEYDSENAGSILTVPPILAYLVSSGPGEGPYFVYEVELVECAKGRLSE
jgi:hypothetical protein